MNVDAAEKEYLFLDTNILVYAFDRSAGRKHELAARLVKECWETENGCLSIQVLQEFYVTVTRKISFPLDIPAARQIVADLAVWRIHSPDASDVLQAIDQQHKHHLSFWDAMVIQSAVRSKCRRLISEDLNPGQLYEGVLVTSPF